MNLTLRTEGGGAWEENPYWVPGTGSCAFLRPRAAGGFNEGPQIVAPGAVGGGVIHVAKFELGAPQLNPLPPPLDVRMKLAIHARVRSSWNWES